MFDMHLLPFIGLALCAILFMLNLRARVKLERRIRKLETRATMVARAHDDLKKDYLAHANKHHGPSKYHGQSVFNK